MPRGPPQVLDIRRGLEDPGGGTDERLELRPVCLRNPEQLADHRDRKGERKFVHDVDAAPVAGDVGQGVEEPVAQGDDMGAELFDRAGGEGPGHQAPKAGVVGGIEREHGLATLEELEEVRGLLGRDSPPADPHPEGGVLIGSLAEMGGPQHPLAVVEAAHDPAAHGGTEQGSALPDAGVVGIGVGASLGRGQERQQLGVEVERISVRRRRPGYCELCQRSVDPALAVSPVGLAQLALEHLPRGIPGENGDEVDRRGALVVRQPLPAEGDDRAFVHLGIGA